MYNIEEKIKEYILKNRKKCFALSNWNQIKMKGYSMKEMLECICKAANGSISEMDNIIEHLTAKQNVYGRTQVYAENPITTIDIVRNSNGELELTDYKSDSPLPLKGQHQTHNPKIYRKSDDQVSKTYQNAEERMYDLGKKVRELYPDEDNHFITFAMQAIRKYAAERKIHTDKVVNGLKKGRYKIDSDIWRIVPNVKNENKLFNSNKKTIIINEDTMQRISNEVEMTEQKFHTNIRNFISQLLQDPVNAQPSKIFKLYGYNRYTLLKYLLHYDIIEREEHVSDKDENGEPKTATMLVKFKCPKKNFDRKLQKLYIRLFEKNLPNRKLNLHHEDELNEEGDGGAVSCGATSASSSGQFIQPFGAVQRRKMPTEIDETTDTNSVGNYQYTVPFGGDKETLARKNGKGGSVSINEM